MEQRELETVRVLIETAQRAGRSEAEIVAIVERYFGEDAGVAVSSSSRDEQRNAA
jgi:hypothetical protein